MPVARMKPKSLFEDEVELPFEPESSVRNAVLDTIDELNIKFDDRYRGKLVREENLSRSLVSFQANKERPFYRWFKYKEAFSAELVEHLLHEGGVTGGVLFDPFAGIGTALFAAGEMGLRAEGIELLPIGQRVIQTKKLIDSDMTNNDSFNANSRTEMLDSRCRKSGRIRRPFHSFC